MENVSDNKVSNPSAENALASGSVGVVRANDMEEEQTQDGPPPMKKIRPTIEENDNSKTTNVVTQSKTANTSGDIKGEEDTSVIDLSVSPNSPQKKINLNNNAIDLSASPSQPQPQSQKQPTSNPKPPPPSAPFLPPATASKTDVIQPSLTMARSNVSTIPHTQQHREPAQAANPKDNAAAASKPNPLGVSMNATTMERPKPQSVLPTDHSKSLPNHSKPSTGGATTMSSSIGATSTGTNTKKVFTMVQEPSQTKSVALNKPSTSTTSKKVLTKIAEAVPSSSARSKSTSPPKICESKSCDTTGTGNSPMSVTSSSGAPTDEKDPPPYDPLFASLVKLEPVPDSPPLPKLTAEEIKVLEDMLQFGDATNPGDSWKEDWSGNLQFVDKEIIINAHEVKADPMGTRPRYQTFLEADADRDQQRSPPPHNKKFAGIRLLFSYIYHMKGTPEMAKRILAYSIQRPALSWIDRSEYIMEGVARISYDPDVLLQDGWTLKKSPTPQGASGGAHLIGRKILWQKYEAVVFAFVHDEDMGDLWKAMWVADQETFDLEADELHDSLKKWETKQAKKRMRTAAKAAATANAGEGGGGDNKPRSSNKQLRYKTYADFTVEGVEHGIVLAASTHPNARKGVMWPARVVHVSELDRGFGLLGSGGGRGAGSGSTRETSTGSSGPGAGTGGGSTGSGSGAGAPSAAQGSTISSNRRGAAKRNLTVIFLAPYWNGQHLKKSKGSYTDVPTSVYSTGPLFQMETIEPTTQYFQKYPYGNENESDPVNGKAAREKNSFLSIDKVRTEFKFLGLPKAAFPRYLDAHRLAAALKNYGKDVWLQKKSLGSGAAEHSQLFGALTDCHQMAIKTTQFPSALLELPYDYILRQLPHPSEQMVSQIGGTAMSTDDSDELREPVVNLSCILEAMKPPNCFGKQRGADGGMTTTNNGSTSHMMDGHVKSEPSQPSLPSTMMRMDSCTLAPCPPTPTKDQTKQSLTTQHQHPPSAVLKSPMPAPVGLTVKNFGSEYLLSALGLAEPKDGTTNKGATSSSSSRILLLTHQLTSLVGTLNEETKDYADHPLHIKRSRLAAFLKECLSNKAFGEELLSSSKPPNGFQKDALVEEWRKACERMYRRAVSAFSSPGFGNGVTTVMTDSKCNGHLTAQSSFERSVRLPAAIKGARKAGAGKHVNIPLSTQVDDRYLELARTKILPMAHKATYLKRIKSHILSLPPEARGAPLTDDSDGEGGEDTVGSRGSYMAAVAGVASTLQAVDRVVNGETVSSFCAIRPPGHHAGRELRAMNAVSNGFCVLNNAACAALFAVTSVSEGGKGLKRVCVIDFDVHHGNGTQDILCATYDPRFLYVSLHAGGAHINGYAPEGGEDKEDIAFRRSLPGGGKQDGIYPGRCGDTSPHSGVLNLPLGQKVTPHAIGTALITEVQPAVEKFAPDLIILSAGFDAHKNDPLGMGGLSAEDFGSVTDVACHMAMKTCSGRVVSVLEGGYGVPCCQERVGTFVPTRYLNLGSDMPEGMKDDLPEDLIRKLDKCHQEGFLECVKEHVSALARCSKHKK